MKRGLLFAAVLLSACGTTQNPNNSKAGAGFSERTSVDALYEQLLIEQDGWQVWELANKDEVTCLALKPAEGTSPPRFIQDRRATFTKNYKTVSGGAGFFMYLTDAGGIPYYGFYGRHPYRWLSVAEKDGERVLDINNRETVLSWEGRSINFRVDSQPDQFSTREGHADSGTVDFTAVTAAHQAMMECYQRVTRN
jgi:hypothetical protein